jgi:DNA mismatch repair protein MSH4
MKDALDETLLLSDKYVLADFERTSQPYHTHSIVQELIATIIADIGALYKVSEAIAILDMLWSFAHASISRSFPLTST